MLVLPALLGPAAWRWGGDGSAAPHGLTARLGWLLLACYPVAALLAAALARVQRRTGGPAASGTRARAARRLVAALALVGLTHLAATRLLADPLERARLVLDQLVLAERWPQVLAAAAALPPDIPTCHDLDTALYHLDRLADDQFRYAQRPDALLLSMSAPYDVAARCRLADQWLELGRAATAAYALQNTVAHLGEQPEILKRLALVYLVRDELPAARLCLNRLSYDLVWGRWARERLAQIARDPTLAGDADIQRWRGRLMVEDDYLQISNVGEGSAQPDYYLDQELLGLLRDHPDNKMALDYLVSLRLLSGGLGPMVTETTRFGALARDRLPRAWEEGLLTASVTPDAHPDLAHLPISPESWRRFKRFEQIMARYRNDLRAAYPQVEQELGDSYFAYALRLRLNP
jgi:hypothetical protein